ncbi:hypothetical protein EVAR_19124_1 [Eumeta japonica]|uniref:Uncharacterized protein n=1 Tax=Eumeta variegata TaxID=151549 RepID=A0A4C1SQD8_EUMVA|nr:hypothetical protein EVAR_19124_1 [Eumeta japonica]
MGALKNETSKTLETSNKTPRNKNLPKQLSANEKVEEQLKAVQSAVENVSERLNSARDPVVQIDLHEQLQPLQKNGGNVISNEDNDKRARHRQRREGISKENWRKLIKLQIPNPHTQKRLRNHQPTTESHVDSLLKDKTHTGEHVLQIIREAIDTKKSGAKVERVRKPGTKGDTEMQHERGHGGHPEQNEVP